jgi:hypothetical protein
MNSNITQAINAAIYCLDPANQEIVTEEDRKRALEGLRNSLQIPPMKYPVGTKFQTGGKRKDVCTVTDMITTTNLAGEIVQVRYVATHKFMGQTLTDNVPAVTIARGIEYLKAKH